MRRVLTLLAVVLMSAQSLSAQTVYVSPSGDDGRSCTTAENPATPKATLQNAYTNCISAGETLIALDGTYTDRVDCGSGKTGMLKLTKSGTAGNLITVKAQNRHAAILDGQDNARHWAICVSTSSYNRIEGFEIKDYSEAAFAGNDSGTGLQIVSNWIHDIGRLCISMTPGAGISSGISLGSLYKQHVITHNLMHDIGRYALGEQGCPDTVINLDHAIYLRGGDGHLIANNVFIELNRGWAVQFYNTPMSGLVFCNNTFWGQNPNRVGQVLVGSSMTNADFCNNISYGSNTAWLRMFTVSGHSGSTVRNNNVFGVNVFHSDSFGSGTPTGFTLSGTVTGNPNFVSAIEPFNFQLQSSSPSKDAGQTIAAITTDYLLVSRPQNRVYDIGAYELVQTPPPMNPVITITAPTSASTLSTQTTPLTTFAGTCTDTDGTIASNGVTWSNDQGGRGTAIVNSGAGTGSVTWSIPSIALESGVNTLTVTCIDNALLQHQATLIVTFTPNSSNPVGHRLRISL